MEEQMSQLQTEVGFLKEQNCSILKLLFDQNSSKPQTVLKFKPKIGHPKRKCGRSAMIYRRPPAPVEILPPEMLQMIIKRLDTKSMKNCRLVCRFWNVHATPVLANKTEINLSSFFPHSKSGKGFNLTFPPKITQGLIKNIHAAEFPGFSVKLITAFCEKYGKEVKGLYFHGLFVKSRPNLLFLYRILTELCINLQELYVDDIHYDNEQGNITQEQMSFNFSNTLALKVLRLNRYMDFDDDDEDDDESHRNVLPPLSNFLDNVILASKKLETLESNLEYCPKDLSHLKSLKNFTQSQMPFTEVKSIKFPYYVENFTVSLPKEINSQSKNKDKTNGNDQRFLALRNLKIESQYDGKPEPSNFAYYMLERSFPLQSLTIGGDGAVENSRKIEILKDLFHTKPASGRTFSSLSTLKFLNISFEDHQLFHSIVNLTDFPNLTTLEFSIGKYASLQNYERNLKVLKWFEVLSKLKLVHLTLNIQCNIKMSKVASGISGNPSLFRGLETLKITYDRDVGADDLYGSPEQMADFQKALKMTSTLKQAQFEGFQMRGCTLKSLLDFVKKNRLPVKID